MKNKRRRYDQNKKACHGSNSTDFISNMPDEILIMILSLLPMKYAVVTSSLCKRWRFLWSNIKQLNLDGTKHLAKIDKKSSLYLPELHNYIKWVNSVTRGYNHPTVHYFRIHFNLTIHSERVVNRWLQFAVNKQVEILELDLENNEKYHFNDFEFVFPERLAKSSSISKPPSSNSTFVEIKSLRKLFLNRVRLKEAILGELLARSPHLETISIHRARFLHDIRVGGQDLNLKHFEIVDCWFIRSIHLSGFDLESFTYMGKPIDLRLTHLPKLKNVVMGQGLLRLDNRNNNVFRQISSCASSLHTLNALSFKIYRPEKSKLDSVPQLPNLKRLTLTIAAQKDNCLLEFASIVNNFPNLETFIIKLLWISPIKKRRKATRITTDHPHEHLKLFQISGYFGRISDLELAAYMIDNAKLNKIVIDPRWQIQKGLKASKDFSTNEEAARSSAKRELPVIVPQDVKLVIL